MHVTDDVCLFLHHPTTAHLTLGMPSANPLWLGGPVELDERCSLVARSPDLRHFRAFFLTQAESCSRSFIHARPPQVTQAVRQQSKL